MPLSTTKWSLQTMDKLWPPIPKKRVKCLFTKDSRLGMNSHHKSLTRPGERSYGSDTQNEIAQNGPHRWKGK
jgi:hypothetical protein